LHQRVARYRAGQTEAAAPPIEIEPAPERVVAIRRPAASRAAVAYAEPVADPVPPPPAPVVAFTAPAPVLTEPARLHAEPERLPLRVETAAETPALLQIPLPLADAAAVSAVAPFLAVASRADRLCAGVWDAAVVMTASLLFAVSAWAQMGFPAVAHASFRLWLPVLVAVPGVLGALYLAASFATGTPTWGMRRLGLRVASWEGELTPQAHLRRAWGAIISLAALGLGFAWMFCDPQQLTWHDYVSRTYLTHRDG
jgi:uncharacterized RDD family membrane protein YckC